MSFGGDALRGGGFSGPIDDAIAVLEQDGVGCAVCWMGKLNDSPMLRFEGIWLSIYMHDRS